MPVSLANPCRGEVTAKQRIFVIEYLKDGNGRRAAIAAGTAVGNAEAQASQWRNPKLYPNVAMMIRDAFEARRLNAEMEAKEVVRQLAKIARFNVQHLFDFEGNLRPIDELPSEVADALADVEVEVKTVADPDTGVKTTRQTLRVKSWSKLKALELIATYLGLGDKNGPRADVLVINWDGMRQRPNDVDPIAARLAVVESTTSEPAPAGQPSDPPAPPQLNGQSPNRDGH